MQDIIKLQTATLAARARTGDKALSTNVAAGQVRVVRVVGETVTELTGGLTVAKAVEFLNAI